MTVTMCWRAVVWLWLTSMVAPNTLKDDTKNVTKDELVVNLTNRSLHVIPHCGSPPYIVKLVIEGNLIILNETDQQALASYPGLTELHLDNNLVTTIPAKYFSVVPQLRLLHLSRNKIYWLDPEAFSGLDFLVELDLSHNLLMTLPTQLFRELKNLQVLDLSGNRLEVLDSRTMGVLSHLRSVDLQENPWNCSCQLLRSIGELKGLGVAIAGPQALCASPEKQGRDSLLEATALCYPSPLPSSTAKPQLLPPLGPAGTQQPLSRYNTLTTTLTPSHNHSISNKAPQDQAPVIGNTWKFTMYIAAIALSTAMLIVGAIKCPTWHKLLSSYQHQRLREEDEEVVPGVFLVSKTNPNQGLNTEEPETSANHLENGMVAKQEEEDGYIEDLYIADYGTAGRRGYSSVTVGENL